MPFFGKDKEMKVDDVQLKPTIISEESKATIAATADDMLEKFNNRQDTLPVKKSAEERRRDIEKNRDVAGMTTVFYRRIRLNLDIFQMLALCFLCILLGYCIAIANANFSMDEIKLSIRNFFEVLAYLIGTAVVFIWRLYTPPGAISKSLIRGGAKADEQLDAFGRTIPGK